MHKSAALFLLVAACDPHHDQPLDAAPPPIDSTPTGPNTVTVSMLVPFVGMPAPQVPDLIAYRDGDGPWLVPDSSGPGTYVLHVTDAYRIAAVCENGSDHSVDVEMRARVFADGPSLQILCGELDPIFNVHVTGRMLQPGIVTLGDTASSSTAPWSFDLLATSEVHERIAVGTNNKIAIERDVHIINDTVLPDVDVSNGTALTTLAQTINGTATGDSIATASVLETEHEIGLFGAAMGTTAKVAPASVLDPTDNQFVVTIAQNGATRRALTYKVPGPATHTLPDALTGVAFAAANGDLAASFGTLPTGEIVQLTGDGALISETLEATHGYLDATHATTLVVDTNIPDYRPEWRIDPTGTGELSVLHNDGTTATETSIENASARSLPAHLELADLVPARTATRLHHLRRAAAR